MRVEELTLTTNGSGAATGTTGRVIGLIRQIRYIPDGTAALDTGATITITGAVTALPILTQASLGTSARSWVPQQPTHAVADGAALLYADSGEAVTAPVAIAEAIKVVVASGGDTKKGTFRIWVED